MWVRSNTLELRFKRVCTSHPAAMAMEDDMTEAAEQLKRLWADVNEEARKQVEAVGSCGSISGARDAAALPRMNALVQDRLSTLRSVMLRLELIAQQQPSEEETEACLGVLQQWKDQYQALRLNLRRANVKAKLNTERAAKEERDLLFAGGEEATLRRRQLQTQAGMMAAAESITDGLRRTRQMMVQEVERNTVTLTTLDQSNTTLRKADKEYKGQRSLLLTTRHLLTSLQRQDIMDRIIVVFFAIVFVLVCGYIVQKRLPVLKIRRNTPILPMHQPPPELSSRLPATQAAPPASMPKPKLLPSQSAPELLEHQSLQPHHSPSKSSPQALFQANEHVNDPWNHEEL